MKSVTKTCVAVAVAAAALGLSGGVYANDTARHESSSASVKSKAEDAWITTKVKAEMAKDKGVSATHIKVKTNDGVVRLGGTAKSRDEAKKAVAIAHGIKGVRSVENHIQVAAHSENQRAAR